MKIKGIIVLSVVVSMMLGSCSKNAIQSAKMKTNMDSVSYAFGANFYGVLSADSIDLDPVLIAKAMMDGKAQSSEMNEEEVRTIIMAFLSKREAETAAKQADANKTLYKDQIDANQKFLALNKEKEGVKVTPTGLQYEVITMGTGEKPTAANTVRVHYSGKLIDGTEFDSSTGGEPVEFPLANVIPGWTEALQLMPVGSKFKFYIPSELAYGSNGAGEAIKPFSTLIFDVELIGIVK
ncbi:MAG: FKBP-type peptidyl-prolyl cis-trans isomerase [Bacteroidia bacterium]|nr:FKBP-type peptidyl-prolyl cis-trans isomerase [Bacteroidia bacterium]